jgi:3-oxoacyl-[acyl-carrier-protein] synthase II
MSERRVVISGIGVIAPTGATTRTFWESCCTDRAVVVPIPAHWRAYFEPSSTVWAPLPVASHDNAFVGRVERMQLDRVTMLALAATLEALESANISCVMRDERKNTYAMEGLDARSCGVFIGTGIGGITGFVAGMSNHLLAPIASTAPDLPTESRALFRMAPRFNPFLVSMVMPNSSAATVAIKLGATGANRTSCQACAAGAVAIGDAFRAIRAGTLETAIAGGAEYLADEYGGIFRGFDVAKTLIRTCDPPQAANRPFDRQRSGFLFGEGGAAMLVLEEAAQAQRRQVTPIAEIVGFGESFEAHSLMAVEPSGTHMAAAIHAALDDADVRAVEIDYVNAHGTGTELNDRVEAEVIERCYGRRPAVNATKSLTGHTIGAAGAIEAAATALALRDQHVHGCHNLEDPILPLNFVRAAQRLPIATAASHSFAFGGHNAVLVLRRFVPFES